MSIYKVTKRMHFCYGHRLLDYQGKCAHPHGHNALAEVELEGGLDDRGMVVDFGEISELLGEFIEESLDHQMILRRDDPLVPMLEELGEPVYVMDQNPTAENLACLLYSVAKEKGLPVTAVRFWENPGSYAEYREESL